MLRELEPGMELSDRKGKKTPTFTSKEIPMKKTSLHRSAFFNPRVLIGFASSAIGVLLALLAFAFYPGGNAHAAPRLQQNQSDVPADAQHGTTLLGNRPTEDPLGLSPTLG